ncbi:hypothetical protein [Schinkia azotoformans]|uniref:hypothetical protein n=1 Tax=Schinkia azotoformans TaxID=1454 RepID=UPI002DB9A9D2|nr:hypothetical protein [Schinkia azotoformans]MEC1786057.1 hypothetical protein [Schinkia azotoformans]MED4420093.1 hypothetical protein [Schinkia azotoformans]
MSLKQANIQQFKEYSQFTSLKDFNNQMEQWFVDLKSKFSKGETIAIKHLIRFSASVFGVSNAKIGTILKAIHEKLGENAISRSTFKRAILKAKEHGLLTVHEGVRKNGSQSSNLYCFNRYPVKVFSISTENEPPEAEKLDYPNTSNLSNTNNQDINKRNQPLDYTYTSESVPKKFVELVKIHVNIPENWKIIEGLWDRVKIAAWKNSMETHPETMLDIAILAFKQTIRKSRVISLKSKFGYFYGILNRKFDKAFHDYLFSLLEDEDMAG